MSKRPSQLILAALVALVGACGYEDDLSPTKPVKAMLAELDRQVVTLATQAEIDTAQVVPASYIVTFRSAAAPRSFGSYLSEYRNFFAPLARNFLSDPRVKDVNYIDHVNLGDPRVAIFDTDLQAPPALQLAFTQQTTAPVMGTISEVLFNSADEAAEVLGEWERAGRIWFAEPNHLSYLSQDTAFKNYKDQYQKLGPEGTGLWWHDMMNVYAAFDAMEAKGVTEISSPVIAVLDSGLDVNHPAFVDRLWVNPSPGQSGCPGDVNGCDTTAPKNKGDFGTGDVTPFGFDKAANACGKGDDEAKNCPHGTHVAGIIAAAPQGDYAGVCPFCRILPIKIFAKGPTGKGAASDAAILRGMKYLTKFTSNNKSIVRVINSSFGKYNRIRAISVIVSILAKNDILVIGAASNEDSMLRVYPSSLTDAIAVSALNRQYKKAKYSNYGPWVDVAAPGGEDPDQILSAAPGTDLKTSKSGTSMATPMVAGVAGLALAVDPTRSMQKLRASIVRGANPKIYFEETADGFNRSNYYLKVPGESVRVPLLGSGVVDAKCVVEGNCVAGYLVSGKDRVTQGCSVVRMRDEQRWGGGIFLLLGLLLPVLAVWARRGGRQVASIPL